MKKADYIDYEVSKSTESKNISPGFLTMVHIKERKMKILLECYEEGTIKGKKIDCLSFNGNVAISPDKPQEKKNMTGLDKLEYYKLYLIHSSKQNVFKYLIHQ